MSCQGESVNFLRGQSVNIQVRRNYIYEDAFEKLSPENEPNLKLKMRVHLVNVAGRVGANGSLTSVKTAAIKKSKSKFP